MSLLDSVESMSWKESLFTKYLLYSETHSIETGLHEKYIVSVLFLLYSYFCFDNKAYSYRNLPQLCNFNPLVPGVH